MTAKEIEKRITSAGWYIVRQKGSHRQFKHKTYGFTLTVPIHSGDLAIGTANRILKDAGLK